MEGFDGNPVHPILPDPYSWALVELTYRGHPADLRESYIDLVFARGGEERRLRFHAPRQVEVPCGQMGGWCRVYVGAYRPGRWRTSGSGWGNFEPDWCVPSFWASHVVEVLSQDTPLQELPEE